MAHSRGGFKANSTRNVLAVKEIRSADGAPAFNQT